ncbi:MAG: DMT family transporter [Acidobacteriota bacterium]
MRPLALALILASALLHTLWNLLFKRVEQKHIFTFWSLIAGSIIWLPLLAASIPARIWPYALSSALVQSAYFLSLIRAYERSHFSLAYPIARGIAPAFLAAWAFVFLGERLSSAGFIGLAVLLAGLVTVSWSDSIDFKATGSALTVGLFISIYSVIDGAAVRLMSPAAYTVLSLMLTAVLIAPFVLVRYGIRLAIRELKANWKSALAVGSMMTLAYILVLKAYSMGKVSYAGALRESSIIFAALAGWLWLKESFGLQRTLGATLALIGIFLISVAG